MIYVFGILALAATAVFIAGYWRGVRLAVAHTASQTEPSTNPQADTERPVGWIILAAVVGAGVVIALAGAHHLFLYLGPLLAIVSAAANGIAFFLESE